MRVPDHRKIYFFNLYFSNPYGASQTNLYVPFAKNCPMVLVFKVKRSISRSSKQKYHFYQIKLRTCVIPHFHVIFTVKSISCTIFMIEGHLQGQKVKLRLSKENNIF